MQKQSLLCNLEQRVRVIWGGLQTETQLRPPHLIPRLWGLVDQRRWRTSSPDDLMPTALRGPKAREASFIGVSQDGNQSSPKQTRHKATLWRHYDFILQPQDGLSGLSQPQLALWFLLVMGGFNLNQQIPETHTTQKLPPKTKQKYFILIRLDRTGCVL